MTAPESALPNVVGPLVPGVYDGYEFYPGGKGFCDDECVGSKHEPRRSRG